MGADRGDWRSPTMQIRLGAPTFSSRSVEQRSRRCPRAAVSFSSAIEGAAIAAVFVLALQRDN
jgi:hypothetical protein